MPEIPEDVWTLLSGSPAGVMLFEFLVVVAFILLWLRVCRMEKDAVEDRRRIYQRMDAGFRGLGESLKDHESVTNARWSELDSWRGGVDAKLGELYRRMR